MSAELKKYLIFEQLDECPVCRNKSFKREFTKEFCGHRFQWVRCAGCSLVYQNPKLSQEALSLVFNSNNYWQGKEIKGGIENRFTYHDYTAGEGFRLKQAALRTGFLLRIVPPPAKILEIGCATGSFLKTATDYGYSAEGVELSSGMAEWGNKKYNLNIKTGVFEEMDLKPNNYDIISLWGCDGCFHDPVKVYKKINGLLKTGGIVVFNFFDFDHFTRIFRGNFKKSPTAICNFNKKSLKALLDKTRFDIIRMSLEHQYTDIEKICSLSGNQLLLKISGFLNLQSKIIKIPVIGSYLVIAKKAG